eukprot:8901374-Pyramimonas_sp.AAC.1
MNVPNPAGQLFSEVGGTATPRSNTVRCWLQGHGVNFGGDGFCFTAYFPHPVLIDLICGGAVSHIGLLQPKARGGNAKIDAIFEDAKAMRDHVDIHVVGSSERSSILDVQVRADGVSKMLRQWAPHILSASPSDRPALEEM